MMDETASLSTAAARTLRDNVLELYARYESLQSSRTP